MRMTGGQNKIQEKERERGIALLHKIHTRDIRLD